MQAVEAILQQYADAETQDAAESEPGDCIEDVPAREVKSKWNQVTSNSKTLGKWTQLPHVIRKKKLSMLVQQMCL